jgi:hypothetical protein
MGFFDDDIEPTTEQLVADDVKMAILQRKNEMLSEARKFAYDGKDLTPFIEKRNQIRNAARKEWHNVLYKNRGFIVDFYDYNAARLAFEVSNAKNYAELSTNSRMACLAVLLRDCAWNLDLSNDFRKEIIQFISPLNFNSNINPLYLQQAASKCAKALDSYLGHNEYEALWDRFKREEHILKPFTEGDLKTVEGRCPGTLPDPGMDFIKSIEKEKKAIRSKQNNELLSLLCDKESLLPFYYQVLSEVKCNNQDQAKMACLIMAGIYNHASDLKDDDLKAVIGEFDLFGRNFISDKDFDFEEIFRLVQQLSFDFLENTLKDEIFAKGCPNNDCSQTLIEACCRTF